MGTISADSHVIEPHDLWQRYIDPVYRDRAPRLVSGAETDTIYCEDVPETPVGLLAGCLRSSDEVRAQGRWEEDIFPSGYDPSARLKDLERDQITGEVLFPTVALNYYQIQDDDFRWALFRAYNTWLADFCRDSPERFKGIGMITHEDPQSAIKEMSRCRELGHVGIMIPLFGGEAGEYSDPDLDPLWSAAVELDMPIHMHSSTFRDRNKSFFNASSAVEKLLNTPIQIQRVLLEMIFSGVFDRYPGMTLVSAENDAGWAVSLAERADYWWERHRPLLDAREIVCQEWPSRYLRQNVKITFMRERSATAVSSLVSPDMLMWGSDFPHHVSTWPDSQKIIGQALDGLPEQEYRRIVCGNAEKLYGFTSQD